MQNVTRVLAARQARIKSAGPISQPILHPVHEKFFPALPTVIVLFQKLSSEAIRVCFDGFKARTSYYIFSGTESVLSEAGRLHGVNAMLTTSSERIKKFFSSARLPISLNSSSENTFPIGL